MSKFLREFGTAPLYESPLREDEDLTEALQEI